MTFCEQLNHYINQFGCSSKDLVNASGLSTSVISRYRRGDRNPNIRSKQLEQLVDGLYKISNAKGLNLTRNEIYITLSTSWNDISIDFEQLSKKFNVTSFLLFALTLFIGNIKLTNKLNISNIDSVFAFVIFFTSPNIFFFILPQVHFYCTLFAKVSLFFWRLSFLHFYAIL